MNHRDNLKVINVDIDGVLTNSDCYTEEEVLNAIPNENVISLIRKLHMKNYIVVYTARRDELIPATLRWLRMHNIPFQSFSNNKACADIYIDDRAIRPEEIGKILEANL